MRVSNLAGVVVAGAINTDLVAVVDRAPEAGETITGRSFAFFGGGKGANQAVAARRTGSAVALVGAVGDDGFGRDRRDQLAADGIDLDGVVTLEGVASGVALITVEIEGENRIAYVPGPTLRITDSQVCEALDRIRPAVYLRPNEVPADAARAGLRRAKELGAITILNAAPDPEQARDLLGEVDYLIVNEVEARALLGRDAAIDEVARLLAIEADLRVVLTAGHRGAFGVDGDAMLHVIAPQVEVVDTTGAGDTFCGALATRISEGEPFEAALRWAVHAAALATTVAGAQPSIPTREAVERFIARGS